MIKVKVVLALVEDHLLFQLLTWQGISTLPIEDVSTHKYRAINAFLHERTRFGNVREEWCGWQMCSPYTASPLPNIPWRHLFLHTLHTLSLKEILGFPMKRYA